MRLTREQFDDLVRGVERTYAGRPAALRRRIARFMLIGYAGLLGVFLGALVLVAMIVAAMFYVSTEGRILLGIVGTVVLIGGGWGTLRVLLVRLPVPEGRRVTRHDAPKLYEMIDALSGTLHSGPLHEVLVTSAFNAGVAQVPRLGVFGWSRNYLLLGLPLVEQLTEDEFRAVLAHEFAHLSREHGRFSRWIYRVRLTWEKVFEEISRPDHEGVLFRPLIVKFLDWFWPHFNAHAFVLSRQNEYDADAVAGRTAGAAHVASSLARIALQSRHLSETLWPEVWKRVKDEARPPEGTLAHIRARLAVGPTADERARWIAEEARVTTTNADTHPCLTDRLRSVGATATAAAIVPACPPDGSAAKRLLGAALEPLRVAAEEQWRKEADENWRQQHARATALNDRLAAIEGVQSAASMDVDRVWDRARVLMELEGDDSAVPLLREVLTLLPNHPAANFHIGRVLLGKGDATGEPYLHRSMEHEIDSVPHACQLLREHYHRLGQPEKMRELDARMDQHDQQLEASHRERSSVTEADTFIAHELADDALEKVRSILVEEPAIEFAWLGRKQLKHFPTQKLYLLCVQHRVRWHCLPNSEAEQALVARLVSRLNLPGRLLVFVPRGTFRGIARKLQTVAGSQIYCAGTAPR